MYDFANSGYTTVVITAIFNAYFVAVVAEGKDWGTFAWSAALALSYFLVMLTAPAVGAYADAYAAKKKLLLLQHHRLCDLYRRPGIGGKGRSVPGDCVHCSEQFLLWQRENLIAAFLPELARGEAMGKVSGWGWSIGFIGGLVSLGASLAYVTWAEGQGQVATQFVPVTMLITAGLFAFVRGAHLPDSQGARRAAAASCRPWRGGAKRCVVSATRCITRAATAIWGVS